MQLVDANVLLYAADSESRHHRPSRAWLDGAETLIVPWLCAVAFLRISTDARLYPSPPSVHESLSFLGRLLEAPNVISGEPDSRHLERVSDLLGPFGSGGNLVNDAHLAALALQYDATLVSYDNDFGRFPGVRWMQPPPSGVPKEN